MSRRAREASDRLTRALLDLAAAGLRTHCSDPRHTTSGCPSARANGPPPSCCATTAQSFRRAKTQRCNVMNAGAYGAASTSLAHANHDQHKGVDLVRDKVHTARVCVQPPIPQAPPLPPHGEVPLSRYALQRTQTL
jgi:hypothetical protein